MRRDVPRRRTAAQPAPKPKVRKRAKALTHDIPPEVIEAANGPLLLDGTPLPEEGLREWIPIQNALSWVERGSPAVQPIDEAWQKLRAAACDGKVRLRGRAQDRRFSIERVDGKPVQVWHFDNALSAGLIDAATLENYELAQHSGEIGPPGASYAAAFGKSSLGRYWVEVMVCRPELERAFLRPASQSARGRAEATYWSPCEIAFLDHIGNVGRPDLNNENDWKSQGDAERWVSNWLSVAYSITPAESTVRKHVAKWLDQGR